MRTKSEGNSCKPSEAHDKSYEPTTLDDWGDTKPRSPGTALDQLAARSVDIPIQSFTEHVERFGEHEVHGAVHDVSTGDPLDSGNDINLTIGISRIMLVLNAGGDASGSILITGTSVDRDTKAETPADTETLTVSGLSTDDTTEVVTGVFRKGMSDAPITTKWWKGAIVISTSDLTLTDVDTYQVAYEQMNDQPGLTLKTFDADVHITNAAGWFYLYLYTVVIADGLATVTMVAEHIVASGDAVADMHYRERRALLALALDGTTDGFFYDGFFGPTGQQYIKDLKTTIWVNVAQTSGTTGPSLAEMVTSEGNIADDVITVGTGTGREIEGNTGGVTLVGTSIGKLTSVVGASGETVAFFASSGASSVNFLALVATVAGVSPGISAIASGDANVNIDFVPKGAGFFVFQGTACIQVPAGTTAQRPSPVNGMFRYNTDTSEYEWVVSGAWTTAAGGGGAAGEFHSVLYAEQEEFAINSF